MEQEFIENELIILTKATLDRFLKEENPADLIALYTFFYYTAKWQKTNIIKATQGYVKKGLGWGIERLSRSEDKLVNLGLIEKITRRDKTGKVVGWFIKVKYIFTQNSIELVQNTQKPQVDEATSGKQETNALSTNNKNALSTNIYKQLGNKTLPIERGDTPLKRVMSIYHTLFFNEYKINDNQSYGKKVGILSSLLKDYTELQLAYLMIVFFNWAGMSGSDNREKDFLSNNTHNIGLFKSGLNKYLSWTKNISGYDKEFENSDDLLPVIGKHIINLTNNK